MRNNKYSQLHFCIYEEIAFFLQEVLNHKMKERKLERQDEHMMHIVKVKVHYYHTMRIKQGEKSYK